MHETQEILTALQEILHNDGILFSTVIFASGSFDITIDFSNAVLAHITYDSDDLYLQDSSFRFLKIKVPIGHETDPWINGIIFYVRAVYPSLSIGCSVFKKDLCNQT
ncbi:MAG: hypothetical protein AAB522_01060 [Patescibacteria group bacterium]